MDRQLGSTALTKFHAIASLEASLEARGSLHPQGEDQGNCHQETGHHLRQAEGEADPPPARSLDGGRE